MTSERQIDIGDVRLDGQTVIVVDAYCPIARQLAYLFAQRGANLILNVPEKLDSLMTVSYVDVIETLVNAIHSIGGSAIRTFENAQNFEKVVQASITRYGAIHAILSNAKFHRHPDAHEWTDAKIWESMKIIDIDSSYRCTKAVWPHFRNQAYGRIVYLETSHDLSGLASRIASSAAKFANLGLAKTLAKEGVKYNIAAHVVCLSSFIDTQPDGTVAPDDLSVQSVTSLIAVLFNPSMKPDSGSMYEVDADAITVRRFQRASGASLNPDKNFTPASILAKWENVVDFATPTFPDGPADFSSVLSRSQKLREYADTGPLDFHGKVVVVTGAASGLGRCYALAFAKLGAFVVVNDIADCSLVVQEIRESGGIAVPINASVEDGETIISTAIISYGHVDIVVNNAGFVRDKAFTNMTAETWNAVLNVHLHGSHSVTAAAWPYFQRQGYGRVLNTTSTSGIYGSFGQSNYAAAKLAVVGLSNALAQEAIQTNIYVNSIAPVASTGGLAAALNGTGNMNDQKTFKPEYIVPLVLLLCSDKLSGTPYATGNLYEVGCGWQAQTRLRSSSGYRTRNGTSVTPESVQQHWSSLVEFRELGLSEMKRPEDSTRTDVPQAIQENKTRDSPATKYVYSAKEVILYNLAVGAGRDDLSLIFEGAETFQALPTFGVIPFFTPAVVYRHGNIFPNFALGQSLLAEHYLEIRKYPVPTSGSLTTTPRLLDVVDKGRSAIAITGYTTRDSATEEILFYNEVTFFMRGCGGFGGKREARGRGNASRRYSIPADRAPDAMAEYKTSKEQAALYRLTGDTIPIHIDPKVSGQGGFPTPILHGACFMGIAGKHIFERYGAFKSIKVKFTGTVVPGDTLRTEMWRQPGSAADLILFQMKVVESGKVCISGGGVELVGSAKIVGNL